MQIRVQGHGIEVTGPLRDYAIKKAEKFDEFFDNIIKVEVTLDARHNSNLQRTQVCEITIWTAGKILRATDGASDMYAAIDLASEKLKRQLEKHKEKLKHENRRHSDMAKEDLLEMYDRKFEPKHKAGDSVVKVKRFALKPLDPEEAAEEMEMLGHDFYMFKNAKTHEINVVYRRRSGNYGLIEPEIL